MHAGSAAAGGDGGGLRGCCGLNLWSEDGIHGPYQGFGFAKRFDVQYSDLHLSAFALEFVRDLLP